MQDKYELFVLTMIQLSIKDDNGAISIHVRLN